MSWGNLRGYVPQSSTSASVQKTNIITVNTWQHVAMTYENNEIKLYHNGQLLSTTGNTGSGDLTNLSTYNMYISSLATPFSGLMDDIRVYSCALSANEINEIYQETPQLPLALHLKMDESSGATAYDTSEFKLNATLTNFLTPDCWVTGQSGNALEFDGNDDYVNCGGEEISNSPGIKTALELEEFTYTAWIYPHTISPQYQQIIAKGSIWDKGFFMCYGGLRGTVNQSTTRAITTKYSSISANTWQHVAMTYANNEVKLYLNGQLLSASTTTGSGEVVSTASNNLLISNTSYPFDGLIDDVKVYSRALDADEINNIYQQY